MHVIHVSNEFPLNRQMRKAVRRGKLQVVRMRDELSPMGGGIPHEMRRSFRTSGLAAVCMANNGASVGGGSDFENEKKKTFTVDRKTIWDMFMENEGNVQFRVPNFQRDYTWEKEEWGDFWNDASKSKEHYTGGIVLRPLGRGRFEIIDGQQRLMTMWLLGIAAARVLMYEFAEPDRELIRDIQDTYLFGLPTGGRVGFPDKIKVRPYRKEEIDFLTQLVQLHPKTPKGDFRPPHPKVGIRLRMKKAVLFFMKRLGEYRREQESAGKDAATEIRDLVVDHMGRNLVFSLIIADSAENAHVIFESLNGRGRVLKPIDLVKNYFLSKIREGERGSFTNPKKTGEWDVSTNRVDKKKTVDFVRAVHACEFDGFTPRGKIYRRIVETITNDSEVWNFVRCLEKQADLYRQILNPENHYSDWGDDFGKVNGLHILGVERCIPLILAASDRYGRNSEFFSEVLKICLAISMRRRICGDPANPMEFEYFTAARLLSGGDLDTPQKVASRLGARYPISAAFAPAFAVHRQLNIDTPMHIDVLVYIFRKLEEISGGPDVDKDHLVRIDRDLDTPTLLGNYVLWEHGGSPRPMEFHLSSYKTTSMTPACSSWSRDQCAQRGDKLAQLAAKVCDWRVDHLENK